MGPVLLAQVKVAAWTNALNYLASQGVNTATYQTDPSLAANLFGVNKCASFDQYRDGYGPQILHPAGLQCQRR